MKINHLVLQFALLGIAVPGYAIDLYVDEKTGQVFTKPGIGRTHLGEFRKVEDHMPKNTSEDLKRMESSLEEKKKELEALESRLDRKAESLSMSEKTEEPEEEGAVVKIGDKGLEIESKDGNFKAALGGRIQLDTQTNWNDGRSTAGLNDGFGVRRGRWHVDGVLYRDFAYKFEYDFVRGSGTNAAGITDAFARYTYFKPFTVTIGQFKEPFSLESVTSNRFITFIERTLPNNAFVEFANPYRLGISAESFGDRWTARAAFQAEPIGNGNYNNNTSLNSNGNANRNGPSGGPSYQALGRFTLLPWYQDATELVHLGFAGGYSAVNNQYCTDTTSKKANGDTCTIGAAKAPLRFASQPGSNVDRSNWADTGALSNAGGALEVNHFTRFGAELAAIYGPFQFASEYMRTQLSGPGYSDADVLEGYYAYGSYFLTGESRAYNVKEGKFDRMTPFQNFDLNGGWGAWEVAARWDSVDLNSPHVHGGILSNGTVALNWYLNPHVRFMANYVHVFQNKGTLTTSGLNPDIMEFRTQLDW